jgi:hypothetical protein
MAAMQCIKLAQSHDGARGGRAVVPWLWVRAGTYILWTRFEAAALIPCPGKCTLLSDRWGRLNAPHLPAVAASPAPCSARRGRGEGLRIASGYDVSPSRRWGGQHWPGHWCGASPGMAPTAAAAAAADASAFARIVSRGRRAGRPTDLQLKRRLHWPRTTGPGRAWAAPTAMFTGPRDGFGCARIGKASRDLLINGRG